MENQKEIILRKVDVNSLIELFNRGLSVNQILDFTLSSTSIKSIIENDQNTFWKDWETSTEKIFESDEFKPLEILIYNGKFFVSNILPLFSKAPDTIVKLLLNDENQVYRLEFDDAKGLKIALNTTRLNLAPEKLSTSEHQVLFETDSAIASFELSYEILSKINKLKSLSYTTADMAAVSITFKAGNGEIRAFDGTFDLVVDTNYSGSEFEVQIDKRMLSLINSEDHMVYLCPTDYNGNNFDRFVFVSKLATIKSADVAILLKESDESSALEDVDEDGGWNW